MPSSTPLYPDIRVTMRSSNPLALIAAVRCALRRAHVEKEEIRRFSEEVFSRTSEADRQEVCRHWVRVERPVH